MVDSLLMRSKFRGCLLGGLIGDCYGSPFEGEETMTTSGKILLQKHFDQLENSYKGPIKQYTDDTAMTLSVAKCLIDKPAVDYKFMARLFVSNYFAEPKRGYGQHVVDVFTKLHEIKFEDIYKPAREQFSGLGSYGNGGAMRISPIALYFYNNYEGLIEACQHTTKLTHTHKRGVLGALLQCMAIQQCLQLDPLMRFDTNKFIYRLVDKIRAIEGEGTRGIDYDRPSYHGRLFEMQNILSSDTPNLGDDDAVTYLGNDCTAINSVPTAIYCFLRAQSEIPDIKTDNVFRRTIQYAISLGGDTDTIASMAGSLAGAFLGEEYINEKLLTHCEYHKEIVEVADNLFDVLDDDTD